MKTAGLPKLAALLVLLGGTLAAQAEGPPSTEVDPQRLPWVGTWKSMDARNETFHIVLNQDGSAQCDWGDGTQGQWRLEGERVHAWYVDGWHDFLMKDGDGFRKASWAPGTPLEGPPDNVHAAFKLNPAEAADSIRRLATEKDLARLQGDWVITTAVLDGADDSLRLGARVTFQGASVIRQSAEEAVTGMIRLDPTATPAAIETTFTSGDDEGLAVRGIYRIEDGELWVCQAMSGDAAPTAFASTPGSNHLLLKLERAKQR